MTKFDEFGLPEPAKYPQMPKVEKMNERIRLLAEQAELNLELQSLRVEKFAELIVNECLMVCKKTEQYEDGNLDPEIIGAIRAGGSFCNEDIKDHFGVMMQPDPTVDYADQECRVMLRDLYSGNVVVLPKNENHARSMLLVAQNYIDRTSNL
jgi:hypothetical protein